MGGPGRRRTVRAYGRFGADCFSTPFMDIPFSYLGMSEFYSTSGLLLQTVHLEFPAHCKAAIFQVSSNYAYPVGPATPSVAIALHTLAGC